METDSTTTNANGSEFSQTGATANVSAPLDPAASDVPSPPDSLATTDAGRIVAWPLGRGRCLGCHAVRLRRPSRPTRDASNSDSRVTHPVVRISGITEIGRDSKTSKIGSWKPAFEVQRGDEASFAGDFGQRAESVRFPADAVPAPTASAPYGATDELFDRLQKAIAAQTCLVGAGKPFAGPLDPLHMVPRCPVSCSRPGHPSYPGYEGEQVLCALRNFCRYRWLLMRADIHSQRNVNCHTTPTLLFHYLKRDQANGFTPRLHSNTWPPGRRCWLLPRLLWRKGCLPGLGGIRRPIPLCSVQVNVHPIAAPRAVDKASPLTEIRFRSCRMSS